MKGSPCDGHVWVELVPATKRGRLPHQPHPLARAPGPQRVVGISTTVMDVAHPRYSASEALLEVGLAHAAEDGAETRLLCLRDLHFRNCEGFLQQERPRLHLALLDHPDGQSAELELDLSCDELRLTDEEGGRVAAAAGGGSRGRRARQTARHRAGVRAGGAAGPRSGQRLAHP